MNFEFRKKDNTILAAYPMIKFVRKASIKTRKELPAERNIFLRISSPEATITENTVLIKPINMKTKNWTVRNGLTTFIAPSGRRVESQTRKSESSLSKISPPLVN